MATPNDIAPLEDFDDDDDTEGKRDDRGDDCDWEVNIRDGCGRVMKMVMSGRFGVRIFVRSNEPVNFYVSCLSEQSLHVVSWIRFFM